MKTLLLFLLTAVAEIVGCYLPSLWLRKGGSAWLVCRREPGPVRLVAHPCTRLLPAASTRLTVRCT